VANSDWSIDLAIAPDAALARIEADINRRRKRAFGVLKTENEFVGVTGQLSFEIWERQKRAIHARGDLHAKRGGTHLAVEFVVPFRTRLLLGVFALLYVLVIVGIAELPPDPTISAVEVAIGVAGALVLAGLFAAGARSQRADLRAFLERLFADVRRV